MTMSWRRLCVFVLALVSLSRGQNGPADPPNGNSTGPTESSRPLALDPSQNETTGPTTPAPQGPTAADTETASNQSQTLNQTTTQEVDSSTATNRATTGAMPGPDVTMAVSMATASTLKPVTIEDKDSSSWGYVILFFIVVVIVSLCVILYLLRRATRTYSFDLQRPPAPFNHLNEPTGTFEPVYLDDLDRPKVPVSADDGSAPPVTNGTTTQSEETSSDGESAAQDQPQANGLEAELTSDISPSGGGDLAGETSSSMSGGVDLLLDATEEQQNENNNNNPLVCEPFFEINLDESAWCNQLFAAPDAPPSLPPFSPFSFS